MEFTAEAIKEIERLAQAAVSPTYGPNGEEIRIVPEHMKAHTTEARNRLDGHITQAVNFQSKDSFIEYVNRFKAASSVIFAQPGHIAGDAGHITAHLNYHHEQRTPNHNTHIAVFRPVLSEPWVKWRDVQGMRQVVFAEFIEENRPDIRSPEASQLLDLAKNFKQNRKQHFNSSTYNANGDVVLGYSDETEATGSTVMPELLTLGIPVHFGGSLYEVGVFLRHNLNGGNPIFILKMDRPEYIEQDAFDGILEDIAKHTEIKPFMGAANANGPVTRHRRHNDE